MVKTAHASRIEKCKGQLKKARAASKKKQLKYNQLSIEEQVELENKRREQTPEEKLRLLLWDYDHAQLSVYKYPELSELIKEKLKTEINDTEKLKLERLVKKLE